MARRLTISTVAIALIAGLMYFVLTGVGRPMSTDLSIVGQGKPVLVLAHENFSPTSGEALHRLRDVEKEFESRLSIVIADLGIPEGQAFAQRHGLGDGQALFLNKDGQAIQITAVTADENALRDQLNAYLMAAE